MLILFYGDDAGTFSERVDESRGIVMIVYVDYHEVRGQRSEV